MTGRLQDKTAFITGGARGIGRAIARRFIAEGARVAVADLDLEGAQDSVGTDLNSMACRLDVSDRGQVRDAVDAAISHLGHLDILVNNAGYVAFCTFEDCSEELWDRTLAVNLKGTFLCAQAVVGHLKARRSGAIVNLTSVAAKSGGLAAGPPYAASKAGVSALTIGLARELAPYGVRANGIAPGVIDTDMTRSAAHDAMTTSIPLGHKGSPEDVAAGAVFLASEEARHITGEILDVNGGLWMD